MDHFIKAHLLYILCLLSVLLFLSSCSSGRVMTTWEEPANATIRIVNGSNGSIMVEKNIPLNIEFGITKSPHFVEIKTRNGDSIYGTLNIVASTEFTDYSSIKINITQQILRQVLDNQVSQITVNDPTTGRRGQVILQMTLGNRMIPEMEKMYKRKRITPLR